VDEVNTENNLSKVEYELVTVDEKKKEKGGSKEGKRAKK